MIKESPEYIKEYGRTNDIILGIIMFWIVISSIDKDHLRLSYFNEKMDRYLDYQSTQEQFELYLKVMKVSINDKDLNIKSISEVIDVLVEIYGVKNLDYQLHMYGASEDGSGDWWLGNREMMMGSLDKSGGMFSIIASGNGVSLISAHKIDFLSTEDWSRLYRNYNIDKILL